MQKSLIQIACALQNLKIFDKQQVDFVKKSISNNLFSKKMKEIIIYSRSTCPFCIQAKNLLQAKNFLSRDRYRAKSRKKRGNDKKSKWKIICATDIRR